jgi:hypothetical protein
MKKTVNKFSIDRPASSLPLAGFLEALPEKHLREVARGFGLPIAKYKRDTATTVAKAMLAESATVTITIHRGHV